MTYEIVKDKLKYQENNPIHFLKWATKYDELDGTKIRNMNNFKDIFPFATPRDKNDNKFKNVKNTEFALEWFKRKIKETKVYEIDLKGNTESNLNIETLSGIIPNNELSKTVQKLIPYSFILQAKIKLTAPYFSRDDDNFYLIQNPCLKEKVYKVPMIRGSGWKGAIARAGKELINEDFKWFSSYVRVFGTGSDEYRKLIDRIVQDRDFEENLIKYLLFELGKKLTKDDIDQIDDNPEDYLKKLSMNKSDFKDMPYLQVHKGRAIFYPTYFDRLSLEIINPHNRRTRAGTKPIHYEVVPKGTDGTLQIVYIPFDAVLSKDEDMKKQVKKDIEFLTQCIEKVADIGIGAKEKLGWGRFEFVKKEDKEIKEIVFNKGEVTIPMGWRNG